MGQDASLFRTKLSSFRHRWREETGFSEDIYDDGWLNVERELIVLT